MLTRRSCSAEQQATAEQASLYEGSRAGALEGPFKCRAKPWITADQVEGRLLARKTRMSPSAGSVEQNIPSTGQNISSTGQNISSTGQNISITGQNISSIGQKILVHDQKLPVHEQKILVHEQKILVHDQKIPARHQNSRAAPQKLSRH